jgi:hypothetical protein
MTTLDERPTTAVNGARTARIGDLASFVSGVPTAEPDRQAEAPTENGSAGQSAATAGSDFLSVLKGAHERHEGVTAEIADVTAEIERLERVRKGLLGKQVDLGLRVGVLEHLEARCLEGAYLWLDAVADVADLLAQGKLAEPRLELECHGRATARLSDGTTEESDRIVGYRRLVKRWTERAERALETLALEGAIAVTNGFVVVRVNDSGSV